MSLLRTGILIFALIVLALSQFSIYPGGTTFNVDNTTWHGLRVLAPETGRARGDVVLGVNPCSNLFIIAWSTNASLSVVVGGGRDGFADKISILLYSAPQYTPVSPERRTKCHLVTGSANLCTRHIALDVDATTGTTILATLVEEALELNSSQSTPDAIVLLSVFNELEETWATDFEAPVLRVNASSSRIFGDLILSSDTHGGWFLGWTIDGVFEYVFSTDDGASWGQPSVYGYEGVERVDVTSVGPGDWLFIIRRTSNGVFPRDGNSSVCQVDRFSGALTSTVVLETQTARGNTPIRVFRGRSALQERYGEGPTSVFAQIDGTVYRSDDSGASWTPYLELASAGVLKTQLGDDWLLIEGNDNVSVGGGFGTDISFAYAEITPSTGQLFSLAHDTAGNIFAIYNKELVDGGSRIMLMDGKPRLGFSDYISSYWNETSGRTVDFCLQNPRINSTAPDVSPTPTPEVSSTPTPEVSPTPTPVDLTDAVLFCDSLVDECILDDHFKEAVVGSKDNSDLITIDSSIRVDSTTLVVKNSNLVVLGNLTIERSAELHLEDIDHTIEINGCFDPNGDLYIPGNATSSLNAGDRVDLVSYDCKSDAEFASSNVETRENLCSNIEYRQTSLQLVLSSCTQEEDFNPLLLIIVVIISVVVVVAAIVAVKVFWRRVFPHRERSLAEQGR